ncbi:hypothetical protein FCV25MIE_07982, partial [Fagus crenata]
SCSWPNCFERIKNMIFYSHWLVDVKNLVQVVEFDDHVIATRMTIEICCRV